MGQTLRPPSLLFGQCPKFDRFIILKAALTYIVSILKGFVHPWVHIVVIEGHEKGVDDNAEGDEEVHKGVKDNHGENFGKADVVVTTVPNTHHIKALQTKFANTLFEPGG